MEMRKFWEMMPRTAVLASAGAVLASAVVAAVLAGCSTVETAPSAENAPPAVPSVQVSVGEAPLAAPPNEAEIARFQPDVRIGATFSQGTLTMRVVNKSNRPLRVGPANFALIVGVGQVFPFSSPGVVEKFPEVRLEPGMAATGQFQLPDKGDLTGRYVAFSHEGVRPSRCRVEPAAPAMSAPTK